MNDKQTRYSRIRVINKSFEVSNDYFNCLDLYSTHTGFDYALKIKESYHYKDDKKGFIWMILNNLLFSFILSFILYKNLNMDSFSFKRIAFSETANIFMKFLALLFLLDIIILFMIFFIKKILKEDVKFISLSNSYSYGLYSIFLLEILMITIFMIHPILSYPMLLVIFTYKAFVIKEIIYNVFETSFKRSIVLFLALSINAYFIYLFIYLFTW